MKRVRKIVFVVAGLATGAAVLWPRSVGAEHFDILLRVEGPDRKVAEAFMDTTPPLGGVNKRPVMKTKPGQMARITWRMKNASPHGLMKDVTIHFFIVKEDKIGQKPTPDPDGEAGLVDNRFTMDFAPKASATGALRFKSPDAGNYLIRVQSEDTHEQNDHEHFSAIDLQVEP